MPSYNVSAHFAMLENVNQSTLDELLTAVRASLSGHQPRAFGSPDDFVVGAVFEADSEASAFELWYKIADPAIDQAGLKAKRHTSNPQVFEKR